MDHTGSVVLIGYQNYLIRYPGTIPQAVALQLLFDVRFVSALLQSRDNKVRNIYLRRDLCFFFKWLT